MKRERGEEEFIRALDLGSFKGNLQYVLQLGQYSIDRPTNIEQRSLDIGNSAPIALSSHTLHRERERERERDCERERSRLTGGQRDRERRRERARESLVHSRILHGWQVVYIPLSLAVSARQRLTEEGRRASNGCNHLARALRLVALLLSAQLAVGCLPRIVQQLATDRGWGVHRMLTRARSGADPAVLLRPPIPPPPPPPLTAT